MKSNINLNNSPRWHKAAAVTITVALVVALGYYFYPAQSLPAQQYQKPQIPSSAAPQATPQITQSASEAAPSPKSSGIDNVTRLISSGEPKDAFAAAQLLIACLHAKNSAVDIAQAATNPDLSAKVRADYADLPTEANACAGLSAGQLTQVNHLLTKSLAMSNVPGMFKKIMNAASFSTTDTTRDPEFSAAVPAAMEIALQAGDGLAFSLKANEYAGCAEPIPECSHRDPAKQLAYATASKIVYEHETGRSLPTLNGGSAGTDPLISTLSKELTPEQIATAVEEGKSMVFKARGFK